MTKLFLVFILAFGLGATGEASPALGKVYPLKLVDVDGRTLSTPDGVVTVIVLARRSELDKAREVGDHIPERCLGNPGYRMVTIIRFDHTRNSAMRYVFTSLVRRRLDSEAKRLKVRYAAKGLARDPRPDLHAIADFDGQPEAQLGLDSNFSGIRVLVLSASGELLRDWMTVPSAEELARALP